MTFIFCVMFFSCKKQSGDTQESVTGKCFADSIKTLTDNLLVFIVPQGSCTKLFFSK